MVERDDLHYSWRGIDGYNKPYNFVMSPREPGKTSMMWLEKIYLPWKKDKRPWVYFVRKSVEITAALIDSIFDTIINKFTDDNVRPEYKLGSFKDGIVDVKIGGELFFRVVSLSIDLRRIKLAVVRSIKGAFMDEYIIDPKSEEHYLKSEAFKIKEAYTTWRRECEGMLKFYFAANPYSLFNPLFIDWKVPIGNLRKDSYLVGDLYVVHWAVLNPKLREKLLLANPLYQFDEEYNEYALEGTAVNDRNIRLGTLQQGFSLAFVFKVGTKMIGVYRRGPYSPGNDWYHCEILDAVGASRTVYCFDFESMVDRSVLLSLDEKWGLQRFKDAMRKRLVTFGDVNAYYYIAEIYKHI